MDSHVISMGAAAAAMSKINPRSAQNQPPPPSHVMPNASGMSWNGSHSSGASAHEHVIDINHEPVKQDLPKKETSSTQEHVIDINQEPIKQDLPKKETRKWNLFSPKTSIFKTLMKLISSFRLSSSMASGSSAAVTPAACLPISSPFQDLQEAVPIRIYFTASDRLLLDVFPGLKESVKATLEEGGTSTSCRDTLAAYMASLEQVENNVVGAYMQMKQQQQSYADTDDSLGVELCGIDYRKILYNTIFTSLPTVCGAGAFVVSKLYFKSVAIATMLSATAAYVVFLYVAKRMDLHQDDLKIPVKKRKDIIEAINGASKLALGHLYDILALARDLKTILGMADSVESNAIVTKIAALKLGFQQLETKVERCIMDANCARQTVIHTIITNSD